MMTDWLHVRTMCTHIDLFMSRYRNENITNVNNKAIIIPLQTESPGECPALCVRLWVMTPRAQQQASSPTLGLHFTAASLGTVIRCAHGPARAAVMSHIICVVVGFLRMQCAPQTICDVAPWRTAPNGWKNCVCCHGQPYNQKAVDRLCIDHGWRPRIIMRSGGMGYAGSLDAPPACRR